MMGVRGCDQHLPAKLHERVVSDSGGARAESREASGRASSRVNARVNARVKSQRKNQRKTVAE